MRTAKNAQIAVCAALIAVSLTEVDGTSLNFSAVLRF